MYFIVNKQTGEYLKTTVDKFGFTANVTLADTFDTLEETNVYIKKITPRKLRKMCKVVDVDDKTKTEVLSDVNFKQAIQETMDTYLTPQIKNYTAQLKKYDGMILDIRHYLRDENTKLNAYQGWKVMSVLQKLERERANYKKELQRVVQLRSSIKKAVKDSESFEYEDYKNRQIEDVTEFIFRG